MRFLSLSGGGYQGFFTALMLARLEEERGPLNQSFDGFAGTSVGAIIAAGAAIGLPMAGIVETFDTQGGRIFSERPPPVGARAMLFDVMRYLNGSKYDGRHLARVVASYCGEMRMGDLQSPLMVTAVRLSDGLPVIFTPHSHPDTLLREAVLASAAAPMMFPPVPVDGHLHADGGVFANCPDALTLDYAIHDLGADPFDIRILGVGAMNHSPPLSEPADTNMGVRSWLSKNRIFRTLVSAQSAIAERTVSRALGDGYARVDAFPDEVGNGRIGLDVATLEARQVIRSAAETAGPRLVDAARSILDDDATPEP